MTRPSRPHRAPAPVLPEGAVAPSATELLHAVVAAIGGAVRDGQVTMTQAVEAALHTPGVLLAEAGTGTGKSLAYLVPTIASAVRTGRPVIVSTATLALQSQLIRRDLPVLAEVLAPYLGRAFSFAMVKGRGNYACARKVDSPDADTILLLPEAGGVPARRAPSSRSLDETYTSEVKRAFEWARTTSSGDRDDLVPGVSERAWRTISVSARECLGQSCPLSAACFSQVARDGAKAVDVVVTNHAFLSIDATENRSYLPGDAVLVVDEAHELAARVTAVNSGELSSAMTNAAVRRVRGAKLGCADLLEAAALDFDVALDETAEGRIRRWLPDELAAAAAALSRAVVAAVGELRGRPGDEWDAQQARASLGELAVVLRRLPSEPGQPLSGEDVVWVDRTVLRSGRSVATLHVAPLSVGEHIRDLVLAGRTAVLTSATLTVAGEFEAAVRAFGLRPGEYQETPAAPAEALELSEMGCVRTAPLDPFEDGTAADQAPTAEASRLPWRSLDVGSPFDYPRQGILYIAEHLPPPSRDGLGEAQLKELADLVEAADGRALGLFSSRRAAEAAAAHLRAAGTRTVLCQGDDATPTLVARFAAEPGTVLVGTLGLWQGVDVPGPACQLVVIDRIPFSRPDDPLASARVEHAGRTGGNGFADVTVADAGVLLAQGAGRLIRSTSDRGVVAVLDPRMMTGRYGPRLRACLPPFWTTTDRRAALAALTRLVESTPAAQVGVADDEAGTLAICLDADAA